MVDFDEKSIGKYTIHGSYGIELEICVSTFYTFALQVNISLNVDENHKMNLLMMRTI